MKLSELTLNTTLLILLTGMTTPLLQASDHDESRQVHKIFDAVSGVDIQTVDPFDGSPFSMQYLLYLPDNYTETDDKFPLLLFLHGGGETGSDIEKVKTHGPPRMIEEGHSFPMIVVSPQNPEVKGYWDENILIRLLDHLESTLNVDTDRIYLTGLSRGGFGAWCLAIENPDRFAALVPICGAAPSPYGDWLGDMPIWVFHGAQDKLIPPSESLNMVEEIKRAGGNVKFTLYPEAGHDSWTRTYNNPELWEWLMNQERNRYLRDPDFQYDPPFFNPPREGRPYPTDKNPIPGMGGFKHATVNSELHGRKMGYTIVLPESYNEQSSESSRYPVIYYLHGLTGSETADFWNSRYYLGETIKGNFPEVIMVFPNGMNETYMDNVNGDLFIESHIINELIPHINWRYRTNRECVGVTGFSMGAGGAVRFALKYPDLFNYAVAIDGGRFYFPEDPFDQSLKEIFGTSENFEKNTIPSLLDSYRKKTAATDKTPEIMLLTGEKRTALAEKVFHALQKSGISSELITTSLEHDATLFYDHFLDKILGFEKDNLIR